MKHQYVTEKTCLRCQKPIQGRSDKKFCSPYCRSENFNQIKREEHHDDISRQIIKILLKNRKILLSLLKEKKFIVIEETHLMVEGFNPIFHTHTIRVKRKEIKGCFELGYYQMQNKKMKVFMYRVKAI